MHVWYATGTLHMWMLVNIQLSKNSKCQTVANPKNKKIMNAAQNRKSQNNEYREKNPTIMNTFHCHPPPLRLNNKYFLKYIFFGKYSCNIFWCLFWRRKIGVPTNFRCKIIFVAHIDERIDQKEGKTTPVLDLWLWLTTRIFCVFCACKWWSWFSTP